MRLTRLTSMPLMLVLLGLGCAHYPSTGQTLNPARAEFDVPPKQMVKRIEQVVSSPPFSLDVTDQGQGILVTTPQRFPGEWHVARRWQEQTRYRISVIPDFDQPTQKCAVEVRDFTEQRAAEGMKWESSDPLPRPQRLADLLEAIRRSVATATAPASRNTEE